MVALSNKLIVLPPNTFLMALIGVMGPRDPHSDFDPAGSMSCHLKAVLTGIHCSRCPLEPCSKQTPEGGMSLPACTAAICCNFRAQ